MTEKKEKIPAEKQSPGAEISLLLEAASGNEKAFNKLAAAYAPMLKYSVGTVSYGLSEQDEEELYQEALLAFHRAVVKFDPLYEKVTFGLFAKICVHNALVSEVKRIKKPAPVTIVPIESGPDSDLPFSPDDSGKEIEELRQLIRDSLSDYENRVFWSYYAGMSSSEIAEKTGKTPRSVDNAIYRVKRKLKILLADWR